MAHLHCVFHTIFFVLFLCFSLAYIPISAFPVYHGMQVGTQNMCDPFEFGRLGCMPFAVTTLLTKLNSVMPMFERLKKENKRESQHLRYYCLSYFLAFLLG